MSATVTSALPASEITVRELQGCNVEELEALYRQAPEPDSVKGLDGKPQGRMLATVGLDWKPVAQLLRAFNETPVFPWLGKGFSAETEATGSGNNRINLLGYRTEWFTFDTRLEPSVIDGRTCILLDYDHDDNPFPIRRIRDELREVSPGVFLGPAMARTGTRHIPILYFSVDCTNGNAGEP